ncbi:MAG: ATP-binding protein [Desulfobacterales bacterium]|nr:ATP-binding protein [Desulfobacterales bacterium]
MMINGILVEKEKPFRLVKYFTFSSLIIIFIGSIALSMLNSHWARTKQKEDSEDYARLLIENLNHQIFLQFALPVALKYGKIQLRNPDQFEHLDQVVRSTLHSFHVETVNIFDMHNTVSYSFDQELIGKTDLGGSAYQKAVQGKFATDVIQTGNFWEILIGFPSESKLVTFAPLRAEEPMARARLSGPILGVIEIVQDMSEDTKKIYKFQMQIIISSMVVMGILFVVLIFVVKKGEAIIQKRALEQIRLKEELSRAQRLSSLGEMVAGVSHEIRNPLGIIRSSAGLLKKKMEKLDPANTIPEIIVEESERLNNIITDFLNFARPREPNLSACKVEEIIDKNITYLANQLTENRYKVDKRLGDNLPEIMADSEMLYQAFLNIFINAMQAMPDGGKISVNIFSVNGSVAVQIEDDGNGIENEIMEKIWDPFFTTKEKGTGLGLGIVKNLVEAHGGNLNIENLPERGARVTILLPGRLET